MRIEPLTSRSGVRRSTTRSPRFRRKQNGSGEEEKEEEEEGEREREKKGIEKDETINIKTEKLLFHIVQNNKHETNVTTLFLGKREDTFYDKA